MTTSNPDRQQLTESYQRAKERQQHGPKALALIDCIMKGEWFKGSEEFIEWINEIAPSEQRAATRLRQIVQGMLYDLEYEKKSLSDVRQITMDALCAERRLTDNTRSKQ